LAQECSTAAESAESFRAFLVLRLSAMSQIHIRLYWLEACGMMGWLLKDLGWVLLLWPIAWPAAATALASESARLWASWKEDSLGVKVHAFAALLWLLGNMIWMTVELLFDPEKGPGRSFPWFKGPLAGPDAAVYNTGVNVFIACELVALLALGIYYAVSLRQIAMEHMAAEVRKESPELVFGIITPEVYDWAFIGPWIVKDLFWSQNLLQPALVAGLLVILLVGDNLRRSRHPLIAAELFWVFSNVVWIWGELALQDQAYWPRYLSAGFLSGGVGCTLVGVCCSSSGRQAKSTPEEREPIQPHAR